MPADAAGIKAGEKIVKINDVEINHWNEIKPEISKHEGEQITVTVEKNGVQGK